MGSSKGLWLLRLISPRGWEEVNNRPALLDGVCPPGSTRTESAQGAPVRRQWDWFGGGFGVLHLLLCLVKLNVFLYLGKLAWWVV